MESHFPISYADISVVVQGPIFAETAKGCSAGWTSDCVNSVRKFLPGAEIVLSTWNNSDLSNLPFDVLVESEDPGGLQYVGVEGRVNNVIRQLRSTRAGILKASRPYVMKLRSDMALAGGNSISYFDRFAARSEDLRILQKRVLACTVYSSDPRGICQHPYHPSDWFHFGLREDVLDLWNLEEQDAEAVNRYAAEQFLWVSFLRKHGTIEFSYHSDVSAAAIRKSELSIANNLVLLSPEQLEIRLLKRSLPKYRLSLYSHSDWVRMYSKYCSGNVTRTVPTIRSIAKKAYLTALNANRKLRSLEPAPL